MILGLEVGSKDFRVSVKRVFSWGAGGASSSSGAGVEGAAEPEEGRERGRSGILRVVWRGMLVGGSWVRGGKRRRAGVVGLGKGMRQWFCGQRR